VIKIKHKIVYSVLIIAVVFLSMTVFNIYQERKIAQNYKTVNLKEFKYDNFTGDKNSTSKENRVKIHISGAVKNPGFYIIEPGIKLKTIINKIIILRDDAALSKLNLEQKIYNKDQIIIPHQKNF